LLFENENYHRFIIFLQANNLTSLSPYATDLFPKHMIVLVKIVANATLIEVITKAGSTEINRGRH
jgi:hypothetical protein